MKLEVNESATWAIICMCVVILLSFFPMYYSAKNQAILDAVEGGADPLQLQCALYDAMGNNPVCVIIALEEE